MTIAFVNERYSQCRSVILGNIRTERASLNRTWVYQTSMTYPIVLVGDWLLRLPDSSRLIRRLGERLGFSTVYR